jgi:hypothetical protein
MKPFVIAFQPGENLAVERAPVGFCLLLQLLFQRPGQAQKKGLVLAAAAAVFAGDIHDYASHSRFTHCRTSAITSSNVME